MAEVLKDGHALARSPVLITAELRLSSRVYDPEEVTVPAAVIAHGHEGCVHGCVK